MGDIRFAHDISLREMIYAAAYKIEMDIISRFHAVKVYHTVLSVYHILRMQNISFSLRVFVQAHIPILCYNKPITNERQSSSVKNSFSRWICAFLDDVVSDFAAQNQPRIPI